jgi:hypothetical protein
MSHGPDPENNFETPVPPPSPSYAAPSEIHPLPLNDAIRQLPDQYIRVVTRPGAATFAQEQGKAAWNIVWVQLAILTVITTITGFIIFDVTSGNYPGMVNPQSAQIMRQFSGIFPLSYIILTPISFFVGTGIYYLIARAFRGRGTFLAYCYCYLLFHVPLAVVTTIFSVIPFVNYLNFIVGIYEIVLLIFMTMAVHRMGGGRATLAVLALPIILFVLALVIGVIVFMTFARVH